MVFTIGTVGSILLLRRLLMRILRGSTSEPNADYDDFPAGAHARVLKPITPRCNGRIQYRGTQWDAAADEEIKAGETVEIVRFAANSRLTYFVRKIK